MLEINYVQKEEQSFDNGANIKLSLVIDMPNFDSVSGDTAECIKDFYNASKAHSDIIKARDAADTILQNIQNGDNAQDTSIALSKLMNDIRVIDLQTYFDTISCIRGILNVMDTNKCAEFTARFVSSIEEESRMRDKIKYGEATCCIDGEEPNVTSVYDDQDSDKEESED